MTGMLAADRRARILRLVQRDGTVKVVDLVQMLGVSDVTVRRDLDALASQGLIVKVHGGATRPDVSPSGKGRTHDNPDSQVHLGVVVPHPTYYFRRVVDGIRQGAPKARVTVAVSDYDPRRELRLAEDLAASGAVGLLLVPSSESLPPLRVPAVLIERRLHGPHASGVSWVRSDHEAGAEMAMRHLHALAHRRIGLVTRGDTQTAWCVRRGWRTAVDELGLERDAPQLSGVDARPGPRWSEADVGEFLARLRSKGATALLCHSDEDALVITQRARELGWRLPDDLSVVAYDDEIADLADPALTAVSPPKEAVGVVAARTLLDLIAEPRQPARRTSLEPRLIVRASTTHYSATVKS